MSFVIPIKKRYGGKGVLQAVEHVSKDIQKLLKGIDVTKQQDIDRLMITLDGTDQKERLGANAILGVSLAAAHAGASVLGMPLYGYIRKIYGIHYDAYRLPYPMMNILNGGKHADWAIDIQECMIIPKAKDFSKRVQMGSEIFHELGNILRKKKMNTNKGDEGGYAAQLKKNEDAFKLIIQAISAAGYTPGRQVSLAIDAAASEFFVKTKNTYTFEGKKRTPQAMIQIYKKWIKKYPLISVEDGLDQNAWEDWEVLTKDLGKKTLMVGDDLYVTNVERLSEGISRKAGNAILIKLNQIGTLTETISAIQTAKKHNFSVIISHRSGETCDTTIADLAVAVNADYIKTGSLSRSERVAKYNRLMAIEEELLSYKR